MMENRMNFLNKHILLQCATVVREMKIYWVFSKQNMSLDSTSGFCENLHAYVIIKLVLKKSVKILYPNVTGWKWSEFSYFLKIVFQVQYHKNWNQKPHKNFTAAHTSNEATIFRIKRKVHIFPILLNFLCLHLQIFNIL